MQVQIVQELTLTDQERIILTVLFVLHSKRAKFGFKGGGVPGYVLVELLREAEEKGWLSPRLFTEHPCVFAGILEKKRLLVQAGGMIHPGTGAIDCFDRLPTAILLSDRGYLTTDEIPDLWTWGMLADELAAAYAQPPP